MFTVDGTVGYGRAENYSYYEDLYFGGNSIDKGSNSIHRYWDNGNIDTEK